jgi:tetratricopeptide (TPR) repeat protein
VTGAWLAIGALALVLAFFRGRPQAPAASSDPVSSMDGMDALRAGTQMGSRGEYDRSLPYLRRALAANPDSWEARFNLASSLANTALEARRHLGHDEPVTRSSADRLALLRESELELESAFALARTPHEAALAMWTRGNLYRSWGLPADALVCARRALEIEPTWNSAAQLVATIEADFARADRTP